MIKLQNQNLKAAELTQPTRGGFRQGSGRKGQWKSGATKAVKLPVQLIPRLLDLAKVLDEGGEVLEVVTKPTATALSPTVRQTKVKMTVGAIVEYSGVVVSIAAWKPESRLVQLKIGNRLLPNFVAVGDLKPVGANLLTTLERVT